MAKERNIREDVDWSAMTRNNQYKNTPSLSKNEVAAPKPAQVTRSAETGRVVNKKENKDRNQ